MSQTDRQILFVVDMEGGQGKSFLTDFLIAKHDAIAFDNGKTADIKYGYKGQKIVVFDLCRSETEYINYGVIENIVVFINMHLLHYLSIKIFEIYHY
jgi:ubiquinone biosynthesis protein COQ9